MEAPYTPKCAKNWDKTGYNISRLPYSDSVSNPSILSLKSKTNTLIQSSLKYCHQKRITENCECFHPNLMVPFINSTFGYRACSILPGGTDYSCLIKVFEGFFDKDCPCNVQCK